MKIGTKSVLFGVHQFIWHPLVTALAWRKLYRKWPRLWEWCALICHDLGYWGKPNMDGHEGRQHPVRGAEMAAGLYLKIARVLRRPAERWEDVFFLALHHSREFAKLDNARPSRLCWPDKYSVLFEPRWFYLLRGKLTGEVTEFKQMAIDAGLIPADATDGQWLDWYRRKIQKLPAIDFILHENPAIA